MSVSRGELYFRRFAEGFSYTEIADSVGILPESVQRMIKDYQKALQTASNEGVATLAPKLLSQAVEGLSRVENGAILGYAIPANEGVVVDPVIAIDTADCAVFCDLHCPYHNRLMIARLLHVLSLPQYQHIETAAIIGDIFDFAALSGYGHNAKEHDPDATVLLAGAVLRAILQRFKKTYICSGNHDERAAKKMDRSWGLPILINAAFGKDWPQSELHVTNLDYMHLAGGDWLIGHPSRYSGQGGKTPADIAAIEECNVITGHNHRVGWQTSKNGKYIGIDTGHLTEPGMHYYAYRRLTTFAHWSAGFTIVSNGYGKLFSDTFTDWHEYGC